jgi:hypothetical protein
MDGDSDEGCGANGGVRATGLRSVRKRAKRPITDEVHSPPNAFAFAVPVTSVIDLHALGQPIAGINGARTTEQRSMFHCANRLFADLESVRSCMGGGMLLVPHLGVKVRVKSLGPASLRSKRLLLQCRCENNFCIEHADRR